MLAKNTVSPWLSWVLQWVQGQPGSQNVFKSCMGPIVNSRATSAPRVLKAALCCTLIPYCPGTHCKLKAKLDLRVYSKSARDSLWVQGEPGMHSYFKAILGQEVSWLSCSASKWVQDHPGHTVINAVCDHIVRSRPVWATSEFKGIPILKVSSRLVIC
jgi:hypothetical protein